ncbi:hypothetical protein NDU88_003706 [Pleurodeles waltl]|uniref:Uncharacterized protein n=1 Tax=Pleurodeles waltl TaxID=8319 RepID=A0AAV7WTK2_PLEWA|nr:hypothetical protein NDU88_003706 [Pleurodeles waltl]
MRRRPPSSPRAPWWQHRPQAMDDGGGALLSISVAECGPVCLWGQQHPFHSGTPLLLLCVAPNGCCGSTATPPPPAGPEARCQCRPHPVDPSLWLSRVQSRAHVPTPL